MLWPTDVFQWSCPTTSKPHWTGIAAMRLWLTRDSVSICSSCGASHDERRVDSSSSIMRSKMPTETEMSSKSRALTVSCWQVASLEGDGHLLADEQHPKAVSHGMPQTAMTVTSHWRGSSSCAGLVEAKPLRTQSNLPFVPNDRLSSLARRLAEILRHEITEAWTGLSYLDHVESQTLQCM